MSRKNYKPIGEFIRKVEIRNSDLKVTKLLGLSMTKEFRETTSNIVGTDMSVYKVMTKYQFACDFMSPIRVNKLPVVLKLDEIPNIVSPAYPVFEVIDRNILDPEYLMMWFRRTEFDRYVTFKCDAAIRGGYDWEDLCETLVSIPSITKQREIVKEYNVIKDRIALNQQLIQKLEETAQAIYKQWFVNFEFPDENGKPYKSNGGEMVESELGEIPKEWEVSDLGSLIGYKKGFAFKSEDYKKSGIPVIRVSDFTDKSIDITNCIYFDELEAEKLKQYELKVNDIIITTVGSWPDNPDSIVGKVILVPELANNGLLNQNAVRLRAKEIIKQIFIYYRLNSKDYSEYVISGAQGSANQASVTLEHIFSFKLVVPQKRNDLFFMLNKINDHVLKMNTENYHLLKMRELLLSKLATVED